MEKLVTNRVTYFVEKHNILSNRPIQSGIRKGRSTVDHIIIVIIIIIIIYLDQATWPIHTHTHSLQYTIIKENKTYKTPVDKI